MIHPLCGFSLEMGTGLIATFEMATYMILFVILFCGAELQDDDINTQTNGTREEPDRYIYGDLVSPDVFMSLVATLTIIVMASYLLQLKMYFVLTRASDNRDASACRLWLWLQPILFVLNLTVTVLVYATVDSSWYWTAWFFLIYAVYCLWEFIVVNEFRKEVKATCRNVKLREEICDEV